MDYAAGHAGIVPIGGASRWRTFTTDPRAEQLSESKLPSENKPFSGSSLGRAALDEQLEERPRQSRRQGAGIVEGSSISSQPHAKLSRNT